MASDETAAKLRTFALILKLGNDLFNAADFMDAAAKAVNDSKILLNFRSAALFESAGKKHRVIAQYGIPEVNPRAKVVLEQQKLLDSIDFSTPFVTLDAASGLPGELARDGAVYFITRLPRPAKVPENTLDFVWLLEYSGEVPGFVEKLSALLGSKVAEALYFHHLLGRKKLKSPRHWGKWIINLLLIMLLIGAMFIPVHESCTAEFTLKPAEISTVYAKFDGTVAEALCQDGDEVYAGQVIARYDTALLEYKLEEAKSQLLELEAQIALEERNAFTDAEKLGKVQLLYARKEVLLVAVKEAEWFLKNAEIKAPVSGKLVLPEGKNGRLTGRAIRIGEKIFEIYGGRKMVAEIPVNEEESSVLQQEFSAELFLHTAPEDAIGVKITHVADHPELTENNSYCYLVSGEIPGDSGNLKYGMRGIARLYGGKVPLGYRLFKGALLYFRGL